MQSREMFYAAVDQLVGNSQKKDLNKAAFGDSKLQALIVSQLLPQNLKNKWYGIDFNPQSPDNFHNNLKDKDPEVKKMLRALSYFFLANRSTDAVAEIFFRVSTSTEGKALYDKLKKTDKAYLDFIAGKFLTPDQKEAFEYFLLLQNIDRTKKIKEFIAENLFTDGKNNYIQIQGIYYQIRYEVLDKTDIQFIPVLPRDPFLKEKYRNFFTEASKEFIENDDLYQQNLAPAQIPYFELLPLYFRIQNFTREIEGNLLEDANKDWLALLLGIDLKPEVRRILLAMLENMGKINPMQLLQAEAAKKELDRYEGEIKEEPSLAKLLALGSFYAAAASGQPEENQPAQSKLFDNLNLHVLLKKLLADLSDNAKSPAEVYESYLADRQKALPSNIDMTTLLAANPLLSQITQKQWQQAATIVIQLCRGQLIEASKQLVENDETKRTQKLLGGLQNAIFSLCTQPEYKDHNEKLYWFIVGLNRLLQDEDAVLKLNFLPRFFAQGIAGQENKKENEPDNALILAERFVPLILALGEVFQKDLSGEKSGELIVRSLAQTLSIFTIEGKFEAAKGKLLVYEAYLKLPLDEKIKAMTYLASLSDGDLMLLKKYLEQSVLLKPKDFLNLYQAEVDNVPDNLFDQLPQYLKAAKYIVEIDQVEMAKRKKVLPSLENLIKNNNNVEAIEILRLRDDCKTAEKAQLERIMQMLFLLGIKGIKSAEFCDTREGAAKKIVQGLRVQFLNNPGRDNRNYIELFPTDSVKWLRLISDNHSEPAFSFHERTILENMEFDAGFEKEKEVRFLNGKIRIHVDDLDQLEKRLLSAVKGEAFKPDDNPTIRNNKQTTEQNPPKETPKELSKEPPKEPPKKLISEADLLTEKLKVIGEIIDQTDFWKQQHSKHNQLPDGIQAINIILKNNRISNTQKYHEIREIVDEKLSPSLPHSNNKWLPSFLMITSNASTRTEATKSFYEAIKADNLGRLKALCLAITNDNRSYKNKPK